jgi:hypothetical protein
MENQETLSEPDNTPKGVINENVIGVLKSPSHNAIVTVSLVPSSDPDGVPTVQIDDGKDHDAEFLKNNFIQALPPYLELPAADIHVVVSTKSGTGKAESIFESLVKPVLNVIGFGDTSYNLVKTESHETVRKFASGTLREKASSGKPQTVLLLSGDGGIVDLINGLFDSGPPTRYFSNSFLAENFPTFPSTYPKSVSIMKRLIIVFEISNAVIAHMSVL